MATFKGAAKEAQRALMLMKQREKEKQELELQKRKLAAEMRVGEISTKFVVHYDAIEQQLRTETSLLSFEDNAEEEEDEDGTPAAAIAQTKQVEKAEETTPNAHDLPLTPDQGSDFDPTQLVDEPDEAGEHKEEEEEREKDAEEVVPKKRRLGMNPTVDTSFLPDVDRDLEEKRLRSYFPDPFAYREDLRREWVDKQAAIKEEEISITYSYWDGSGHRKQLRMKKSHSIHLFLHRCLEQLRKDFSELKSANADQLMYIKEDLIIPHHYTFYDFIVTKARGKSGPLFCFDVRDDIRVRMDAKVEKEESHAGKICLRSWYERNKHIFPASRWEPYDPAKNWDQYTVSDKMATKINIK